MAKKQQIVRALDEIAELFSRKADDVSTAVTPTKTHRPRVKKSTSATSEKVDIVAGSEPTIEIPNSTTEALKDFNQSVKNLSRQDVEVSEMDQRIMRNVLRQYPDAFNRTPVKYELPIDATHKTAVSPQYTSNDFEVKDYFKPQQYRNIDNIDAMFEEAANLQMRGLDNAARQFGSAGLSDVAAIAKGLKPTSFKYKPSVRVVPTSVLQEIVLRRKAPIGTLEWLQRVSAKNPDLGVDYLDLFARNPKHFQQMYDINGDVVK